MNSHKIEEEFKIIQGYSQELRGVQFYISDTSTLNFFVKSLNSNKSKVYTEIDITITIHKLFHIIFLRLVQNFKNL